MSDVRAQREARGGCGWAYGLCMRRPRGKGVSEHRPGSSERANIPGRPTVQGLGGRTVPFAKLGKWGSGQSPRASVGGRAAAQNVDGPC